MRPITQAAILFMFPAILLAQVSVQINLPRVIAVQSEQVFEVKINKGSVINFSKYQMAVPEGITITEVDSRNGSFSFEGQHAKVIWAITPSEPEIIVKFGMTATSKGTFTMNQKYYYLENEGKREVEVEPFVFEVKDANDVVAVAPTFVPLKQHVPTSIPAATPRKSVNPDDPNELRMHALQLKKDSREAYKVGEAELKKAEENLEDANSILRLAEHLEDDAQKQKVIKHANAARDRAQVDIQVANKILALAESLEKDANDIQKLNKEAAKDVAATGGPENPENKQKKDPASENAAGTVSGNTPGMVFRLQLGAFGKLPVKSGFRKAGDVMIINEDGLYKVLLGSFSSREAALKKRDEVIARGFEAFVVTYRNGIRVK